MVEDVAEDNDVAEAITEDVAEDKDEADDKDVAEAIMEDVAEAEAVSS